MADQKKIQVLSQDTVNQIAAGEVVDRPAHMVKELCENSIDAGATDIQVRFSQGGRQVQIKDNGSGIPKDDLLLALTRYATSKILESDDIWRISSYGFRGEALASIGSVANLKLTSRVAGSPAHTVQCQFGVFSSVQECGGEFGTVIDVENLFGNVPARLKFLKSDSAESVAIKNQLKALAMANPAITFRVFQDQELQFYWPQVSTTLVRVQQVFSLPNLYEGHGQVEDLKTHVVLASPNDTAKTAKNIWLFVKGRSVTDRSLQAAVLEGYRNYLMHGEFPHAAVFLDCDPGSIDVNVSPTKSQVKFRDPQAAFRSVHYAVRGVLERAPWLAEILPHQPVILTEPTVADPGGLSLAPTSPSRFRQIVQPTQKTQIEKQPPVENLRFQAQEFDKSQFLSKRELNTPTEFVEFKSQIPVESHSATSSLAISSSSGTAASPANFFWSNLELIGQAHLTYLVTQSERSIFFIDQHAAHERILFEKINHSVLGERLEVQNLLMPVVIHLPEGSAAEVMKYVDEFQGVGVQFEQMGPNQIAVQSYPILIRPEALQPLFQRVAEDILENGQSYQMQKSLAEVISTMACHSAVRAGQALSVAEMKSLLLTMDEYPQSSFCPHGRPVFVEYPIVKLEKDFGRTL